MIRKIADIYRDEDLFVLIVISFRFLLFENQVIRYLCKKKYFNRAYWFSVKTSYTLLLRILRFYKPEMYLERNPFKIVWIEPEEIEHEFTGEGLETFNAWIRYGRIIKEDLDEDLTKFEETDYFRELKDYFNGKSYAETKLPEYYRGRDKKHQKNAKEREKSLKDLKNSLSEEGYKTQKQLYDENPTETLEKSNDSLFPELNEIQVVVAEDNEFIRLNCGRTRLALAKLLDFEEVPVIVKCKQKNTENSTKNSK